MARYWYSFTGSDYTNPNHYFITGLDPTTFCATGPRICAIYREPNPLVSSRPLAFDQDFIDDLNLASGNQTQYPAAPSKPYVYVKAIS